MGNNIILIIEHADGTTSIKTVTPPGVHLIKVQSGDSVRIVELVNGKEVLLDDLIAQKNGDGLDLIYTNGVEIQIKGFYTIENTFVFLPGEEEFELTSESGSVAIDENVTTVVYAHGNSITLMELVQGNDALESAIISELGTQESGVITLEPTKPTGGSSFPVSGLLFGSLAGGVAAVGLGGDVVSGGDVITSVIKGVVTAGPLIEGHGLVLEVYSDKGKLLGPLDIQSDGSFRFELPGYQGLVMVRVVDTNDGDDYDDELSGDKDLTTNLRALVALNDESGEIVVNPSPLTEILTRNVLGDEGADDTKSVAELLEDITAEDLEAANALLVKALKLSEGTDVVADTPHAVNAEGYEDASATAQALGQALAAISGAEGEGGGKSTSQVIQDIVDGVSRDGSLSQSVIDLLVGGIEAVDYKLGDGSNLSANLKKLFKSPVTNISLSADTGSSADDFITSTEYQTISAELSEELSGEENLWGSTNGGEIWTKLTDDIVDDGFDWTTSLDGDQIRFIITTDDNEPASDESNWVGASSNQRYNLDTVGPEVSINTFDADENGTEVGQVVATDDNEIKSYTLTGGADMDLFAIDEGTGVLSFKTNQNFEASDDAGSDGTYDVEVTVTDAAGNETVQDITVNLQDINEAPEVVSGAATESVAVLDQVYTLDAAGLFSDPDAGDTVSYSATGLLTGLSIDPTTGEITGTATEETSGAVTATITATDGDGLSVTHDIDITVVSAPVIASIALQGGAKIIQSGGAETFVVTFTEAVTIDLTAATDSPSITLTINGTDVEARYISVTGKTMVIEASIPAGDGNVVSVKSIDLNGATVIGDISGQGWVTDAVGQTTDTLVVDDTGPTITTTSVDADENGTEVGQVVATDDNEISRYTLTGGADMALFAIDEGTGVLSFKTNQNFEASDDAGSDGTYDVEVTVTDAAGNETVQDITVNLQDINEAPEVVSGAATESVAGLDQNYTLDAAGLFSDPDAGDTVSYSATGLLTGLSIDPTTGEITGTATEETSGAVTATITATDGDGLSVTHDIDITVVSAPVIASIALQGGAKVIQSGGAETFVVTFTEAVTIDTTGATSSPSITLTINGTDVEASYVSVTGNTMVIEASIPEGDGNEVSVKSIDLNGVIVTSDTSGLGWETSVVGQTTDTLTIDDTKPTIVSSASVDADENGTEVGQVVATDDNEISRYTLTGGADMDLFAIDKDTGVLSFKTNQNFEDPGDANDDAAYDVEVTVTDAAGNETVQDITVNLQDINEAPEVVSGAATESVAGLDQNYTLDAAGLFSDPDAEDELRYSASGLPDGLTINEGTGEITGTATEETSGAVTATITATDGDGLSVTHDIDITVVSAPVIASIALQGGAKVIRSGGAETFVVTFTEAVTIDLTDATGPLTITLTINGMDVETRYDSQSGKTMVIEASIPAGDGNVVSVKAINLNGATVTGDISGQGWRTTVVGQTTDTLVVDDTGPTITTTSVDADENGTEVGQVVATDDNEINRYTLTGGADMDLFAIDKDTGVLSFKTNQNFEDPGDANNDAAYDVEVSVRDEAGNETVQAITVNLQDINEAPEVVSGAATESVSALYRDYTLDAAGLFSDPDADDELRYSATDLPDGLTINEGTGEITGTATEETSGAVTATITATDSAGLSVEHNIDITVVSPPVIDAIALQSGADVGKSGGFPRFLLTFTEAVTIDTTAGEPIITLTINGTDVDFNYVEQEGTDKMVFIGSVPAGDGNVVSVKSIDLDGAIVTGNTSGLGWETSVVGQTTNTLTIDDTPPTITTLSFNANENGTEVGQVVATDGTKISYALSGGADSALFTIHPETGALSFNSNQNFEDPGDEGGDGAYEVEVTVTDAAGNETVQDITVNLQDINEAPKVVSGAATESVAALYRDYTLDAAGLFSDPDADDELRYSASGLPDGLTINEGTGEITGTATEETTSGAVTATITVTDGDGLSVTHDIDITVVSPPVIVSIASSLYKAVQKSGEYATFDLTFSEDITIDQELPGEGDRHPRVTLTINGKDVEASYWRHTVNTIGLYVRMVPEGDGNEVSVKSIDLHGAIVTGNTSGLGWETSVVGQTTDTLTIDGTKPTIVSSASFNANENGTEVGQVVAEDDNGISSYTLTGGADMDLFAIDEGTGVLSFEDEQDYEVAGDADGNGAYEVEVTVTDEAGNETVQDITVNLQDINEAPEVVSGAATESFAGLDQNYTLDAAGLFFDPEDELRYSAIGLPDGLTIDEGTGAITGTATEETTSGAVTATITATDSAGLSVTHGIDITVVSAPVIASIALHGEEEKVHRGCDPKRFLVTFSEDVTIDTTNGAPSITFTVNGHELKADYLEGEAKSNAILVRLSIPPSEGNEVSVKSIDLNGATVIGVTSGLGWETSVVGQTTDTLTIDETKPTIVSSASFNANENGTEVGQVVAEDANGIKSYTLTGGTDMDLFVIDEDTGVLSFEAAQDYEVAGDEDGDGVYEVEVRVRDVAGNSAKQAITVYLQDVDEEAPELTELANDAGVRDLAARVSFIDDGSAFNDDLFNEEGSGAVITG